MRGRRKREAIFRKINSNSFGFVLLFVFLALFLIYSFANSLFFKKSDRVNIFLHSQDRVTYYSLSTVDEVNYLVYFSPDLKMTVPGGYKLYRFGAFAKLSDLDHDPDLLKKAFSSVTSSFIDFYFYPTNPDIQYGDSVPDTVRYPSFKELFFDRSNASFLDRLYLYLRFISSGKTQFAIIPSPQQEEDFAKNYQGFFYRKTYRNEKRLVQIIYTKRYKTADLISRILEGNGIRVVDLTRDSVPHSACVIVENTGNHSQTARDLSSFFNCKLQVGKTGTFDIIFILGDQEARWEA